MDNHPEGSATSAPDMPDTESLIDVSDLIERNILPDNIENTLSSTRKVDSRPNDVALKVLHSKKELQTMLEALRSGNMKRGATGTLQYSRNNSPDISLIRNFVDSVVIDYAPGRISFAEVDDGTIVLEYPMRYVLSSAQATYLDEDDAHYVSDGLGYPAFFPRTDSSLKYLQITGRVSLAHYPSNVEPGILGKINKLYDVTTARAFQNSFQLRSEDDAIWIVRNRARSAVVGDNHLALLLRAFMYYFDSLHLVDGQTSAKTLGQRVAGLFYNVRKDTGWIQLVDTGSKEIVNCLGMPYAYCQFWAYCCFPNNECYVAFEKDDRGTASTPFSSFKTTTRTQMCVISDCSLQMGTGVPSWFSAPEIILSFIEMHVRRFGLHQQANDACLMAQTLPVIQALGLPFSVPEPLHSCDWFEGHIMLANDELSISQLSGLDRLAVIAALHCAPMILKATLYDIQSTMLMHRAQYPVMRSEKAGIDSIFGRMASDPGSLPRFLFQSCLGMSNILVPLLGWDRTYIPIQPLLPIDYDSCPMPVHLLFLQRISGIGSVRLNLPYDNTSKWTVEVRNNIIVSGFNTFMALKRCGMLSTKSVNQSYRELCQNVLPLMTVDRELSVALDPFLASRIRYLVNSGVSLQFCQMQIERPVMPWSSAQPELHDLMARWESAFSALLIQAAEIDHSDDSQESTTARPTQQ